MEFFPADGGNGNILKCKILGSKDGTNFEEIKTVNWANNTQKKSIELEEPVRLQYIKIVGVNTSTAGGGSFIAARMFNFYEDTTVKTVANFSFDGDNAGTISLLDEFAVQKWTYSIDGGQTWKDTDSGNHKLNSEELEQIDSTNNIKIKFNGDEKIYTLSIKKGQTPVVGSAYVNDLENKIMGLANTSKLEWKCSDDETWTSYTEAEPIIEGTRTVLVRTKATGMYTASDSIQFQFTEDNQPDNRKYIPIIHESVHAVSSQENNNARYAIDGNDNTRWLTSFNGSDTDKYYVIKLDAPRYVSALEYIPASGNKNGKIESAQILVSMDGENWKEVVSETNWTYANDTDRSLKSVDFTPTEAQYVKIVGKRTQSEDSRSFMSAAAFKLYEDITKREALPPTAEIEYSTEKLTNQDVVVTLVNASTDITITNNGGSDKYTFTQNGSFTFEFEDKDGNKGTVVANVDWIDKEIIEPTIAYNINQKTNQDVTASIVFNKQNVTVEDGSTYTFTQNGSYTFKFADEAGNTGTAVANVDWIDKDVPIPTIKYSTENPTHQDVIATITFNEENVEVIGGNTHTFTDNAEYTFEFVDEAGNTGTATASVSWIDKTLPRATITYNIDTITNKDVVATVTFDKENVTVKGGNTYTFTENGSYTFEYVGPTGISGSVTATVNWIDKDVPVPTISYSTEHPTNENVVATITFNEENVTVKDGNTYTFTENGNYTFEFEDEAGNTGTAVAIVSWIEKVALEVDVQYSTTSITKDNVIVTLTFNDEVTILNKDIYIEKFDNNVYKMRIINNAELVIEFVDKQGNKGSQQIKVDWIDTTSPTAQVYFDTIEPTKENVVAKVIFSEDVIILNEDLDIERIEKDVYAIKFTENGKYTVKFVDLAGNENSQIIDINWIDRDAPTAEIEYNIEESTTSPVRATIKPSEEIKILNNDGKDTYVFNDNGEFTFEFEDKAGNKGTATAKVDWIRKIPGLKLVFSTEELTNEDVEVTLVCENVDITINNNNGSNTFVFKEVGEFTFEYTDEYGQQGKITAYVDWIDKTVPTVEVEYNNINLTNQDVIATLNFSEEVAILNEELEFTKNEDGTYTVVFEENAKYCLVFVDKAGNRGTTTLEVKNVDKEVPTANVEYNTTEKTNENVVATITFDEEVEIITEDVEVKKIDNNTYEVKFEDNDEREIRFRDIVGNEGKTILKVDWIVKNQIKPIEPVKPSEEDKEDIIHENNNQVNENNSIMNNQTDFIENFTQTANASEKQENNLSENGYNYSSGNIAINISTKQDIKNATLINKKLNMSEEFSNKVGKVSEYLELYLENDLGKIDLESSDISIRFRLDSSKVFTGVYEVKEDNTLEKLEYEYIDENNVLVNTNKLGKYILSYDKKQDLNEVKQEVLADTSKENGTTTNQYIIIAIIIIIILIILLIIVIRKRQEKND